MRPCSRCRPACRPAGSSSSRRARWRSGSPASRSCPSARRSTPPAARSSTARSSSPTCSPAAERVPGGVRPGAGDRPRRVPRAPDFTGLGLERRARSTCSTRSAATSSTTYLTMEDPTTVQPIGLELRLSADVGSLALRGIIDRLELRDGELVVTDYKTGRAPSVNWEQKSLAGVHFYSFLCEQVFGAQAGGHPADVPAAAARPSRPRRPSSRCASSPPARRPCGRPSSGRARPATSRPRPSALCASCSFQPWCPSFGGDPDRAAAEAPARSPAGA